MDMHSLRQWLVVVDHLMTHDKSSFRDLLSTVFSKFVKTKNRGWGLIMNFATGVSSQKVTLFHLNLCGFVAS